MRILAQTVVNPEGKINQKRLIEPFEWRVIYFGLLYFSIENCAKIGGRKNSIRRSSVSKQISKNRIPIIERLRCSFPSSHAVVIKALKMQALNKKKPVSALKEADETAKLVDPKVLPRPVSLC